MQKYAVLCGSAPDGYRQLKVEKMYDFLTSESDWRVPEKNIVMFPNGVNELFLESVLNGVFDEAAEDDGEVLLYFCAKAESDLYAELSDSACAGVEVVRLGENEIRKDVIAYYAEKLADMLGVKCRVMYEADSASISAESIGWEKMNKEVAKC